MKSQSVYMFVQEMKRKVNYVRPKEEKDKGTGGQTFLFLGFNMISFSTFIHAVINHFLHHVLLIGAH